jgi:predicted O-methyltransferase YrrM
LKKIYRILSKTIALIFFSYSSRLLDLFDYKIIPSFVEAKSSDFKYSENSRRLIYKPSQKKLSKLIMDTSHYNSELCILGAKYETNKSALNSKGHRSGYTPYYNMLFRHLKDQKILFAEIGIELNASTKMWRKFFSKAKIYGLEFDNQKIIKAKKHGLKNTLYKKIDVSNQKSIKTTFLKINKKFDVIIDDSTHLIDHQINIIKETLPFLKQNGILIIEDIFKKRKNHSEQEYYNRLQNLNKNFKEIYFVEFHNLSNWTASWKCEKILVLIKN